MSTYYALETVLNISQAKGGEVVGNRTILCGR